MTTTISVPQTPPDGNNCAERQLLLYEAIRFQISNSFFSRRRIDEDELLHALFVKLIDKFLPPFESEELADLLQQEIRHTIRDFKLVKRHTLDIDEVDPDDGPFYDDRKKDFETEFEEMFQRFCESCEEPQRTIYQQFRTVTQTELARVAGITRSDARRFIKNMPKKFQEFLENFCD